MAADTLTDAQARALRRVRDHGTTTGVRRDVVARLRLVGMLGPVCRRCPHADVTPAGREALARHESEARDA